MFLFFCLFDCLTNYKKLAQNKTVVKIEIFENLFFTKNFKQKKKFLILVWHIVNEKIVRNYNSNAFTLRL